MRYLQRKGFRVIPVNPRALDAPILGEQVYPDLESIPVPVDVVDVFRRPEDAPGIAESAVAIGAKVLWLQLGIRSPEAATIAGRRGPDRHPGPVHEDRVRAPVGRARLERGQHADPLQPAPERPAMTRGRAHRTIVAPPFADRRGVRLRDAGGPRGRPPDPVTGSRNVPIHQTTSYVFEDVDHAGGPVQPPDVRLHLLAPDEPDRRGARGAGRGARGRAGGRRRGVRPRRPAAGLLHAARARRPRRGGAPAVRRLADPAAAHVRAAGLARDVRRRDRSIDARRGGDRASRRRRCSSSRWPTRAASSPTSRPSPTSRTRASIPLDRRQHARDAVPVPAVRVGRGPRRPLADQVPVRPRHVDGRHGRRVRAVRLEGERQVPVPRRARPGVPRARLLRDLRRLRVLDEGARGRVARPRAGALADQRVPHPDRHRDAAAADGAACRERAERWPSSSAGTRPSRGCRMRACRRARPTSWRARYLPLGRGSVFTFGVRGRLRRRRPASSSRWSCGRTSRTSATRAA